MSSVDSNGILTQRERNVLHNWWRRVTAVHPKSASFDAIPEIPRLEKGVFGVPLNVSIKYARCAVLYYDGEKQSVGYIPTVVAKCGSFLKKEGFTTEGIFRLSGNAKRIRVLQSIFDTPDSYGADVDWRGYTVHDASSVMKRFLCNLPEPVIPITHYQSFINVMDEEKTEESMIQKFQVLMENIPVAHHCLLLYLLDMLHFFGTAVSQTRMANECLACVFAPCIFAHQDDHMNPESYRRSKKTLEFLIKYQGRFNTSKSQAKREDNACDCNPGETAVFSMILGPSGVKAPKTPRRLPGGSTPVTTTTAAAAAAAATSHRFTNIYPIFGTPCVDISPAKLAYESKLSRSKTMPSKRTHFGQHEPTQVVKVRHVVSLGSRPTPIGRQQRSGLSVYPGYR